jgi:NADH-quinone oxidoreductase subunit K
MMLSISINLFVVQFATNTLTFLTLFIYFSTLVGFALVSLMYTRRNLILTLINIELIMISVSMNFAVFSSISSKSGQALSLYVLTVAAVESSIGLSLFVSVYRLRSSLCIDSISGMRG